jgi:hypothetical protein
MGDTRSAEHTRLTRQIAHLEDQITQYNAKLVEELHLIAVLISIPENQRPRLLLPEGLKERLPSPFPPTQHKE